MKDYLDIILGTLALIGAIYRLSQVEANINTRISRSEAKLVTSIDGLKDSLTEKVSLVDRKLDTHLTEYKGDKEYVYLYRLNNNEKTIEHKFNRLAHWITQIAGFLNRKAGFQIRDDRF